MQLRPYQNACMTASLDAFRTHLSVLTVLATGLGKTMIFSMLAGKCVSKGKRVLCVAHREELITQAVAKIEAVTGHRADIEMGDLRAVDSLHGKAPVVVASVQSLNAPRGNERRMKFFDPTEFGLIILDEAHHAVAESYIRIVEYFRAANPTIKVYGTTATPDRGDGEALRRLFETCAFEYGVADGIRDGWLVDIEQQLVRIESLDLSHSRTTAGDINGADLAAAMEYEKTLHGIADATLQIVGQRKTLVFAASVAQATRLSEIFNRHRPGCSRIVTGDTPKEARREIFKAYAARDFQFLTNVGVATEGFDDPGIECVVMGRPTKSRSLYAQMLGRGTRILPGVVDGPHAQHWEGPHRRQAIAASAKPSVLVLDFVGNAGRHKLVHAVDILGGNLDESQAERVRNKQEKSSKPSSVLDDIAQAEIEERNERIRREEAARQGIKGKAKFSAEKISPFDVLNLRAPREVPWHTGRTPTEKMLLTLRNRGVENPETLTWTQASALISKLNERMDKGMCTYKQAKKLGKYGYDTEAMTFAEASETLSALAANGWKPLQTANS
jgi:superfamily II DNA or RNA helicase